jgi:hypothetical protein
MVNSRRVFVKNIFSNVSLISSSLGRKFLLFFEYCT